MKILFYIVVQTFNWLQASKAAVDLTNYVAMKTSWLLQTQAMISNVLQPKWSGGSGQSNLSAGPPNVLHMACVYLGAFYSKMVKGVTQQTF